MLKMILLATVELQTKVRYFSWFEEAELNAWSNTRLPLNVVVVVVSWKVDSCCVNENWQGKQSWNVSTILKMSWYGAILAEWRIVLSRKARTQVAWSPWSSSLGISLGDCDAVSVYFFPLSLRADKHLHLSTLLHSWGVCLDISPLISSTPPPPPRPQMSTALFIHQLLVTPRHIPSPPPLTEAKVPTGGPFAFISHV